jgi:hypothetical protein
MTDLRKAAEMALEALETLWDILDDIDTASDMAKENNAWYRKRVEALQKKRWDTTITTDGYKLKGGPVEALRQAIDEAEKQEPVAWWDGKESVVFAHDTIDTPNWTDYWTTPLYKDPTPCKTCEALARTVMMDQTSHDTDHVHAIDISQKRVDETAKCEHEEKNT